jgi:hypothetical protein
MQKFFAGRDADTGRGWLAGQRLQQRFSDPPRAEFMDRLPAGDTGGGSGRVGLERPPGQAGSENVTGGQTRLRADPWASLVLSPLPGPPERSVTAVWWSPRLPPRPAQPRWVETRLRNTS